MRIHIYNFKKKRNSKEYVQYAGNAYIPKTILQKLDPELKQDTYDILLFPLDTSKDFVYTLKDIVTLLEKLAIECSNKNEHYCSEINKNVNNILKMRKYLEFLLPQVE